MSNPRWNGNRNNWKNKKRANVLLPKRPRRNKVYYSKEARQFQKHDPIQMGKRRVPKTRRPQPLPLFSNQAPEYMKSTQSAYLDGSSLPEYAALTTNMLKLGQQNLPFGMRPRTIDAPDHY